MALFDYVAKLGTLTFNPGVVTRTFTVSVVGAGSSEATEMFVVNPTSVTNVTIGDGQGVCTIISIRLKPQLTRLPTSG